MESVFVLKFKLFNYRKSGFISQQVLIDFISANCMNYKPKAVYIEHGAEQHPFTERVLEKLPDTPVYHIASSASVVDEIKKNHTDVFGAGKKHLVLSRFKGALLKKCPGISPGMVCCNYYIVNLMKNCAYDCSYCFLQGFLENSPLLEAFVNVEDFLEELDAAFRAHPDRTFRVGTGELADSLALDDLLPYSDSLIPFFNERDNAVLELKTKSDQVERLLGQASCRNVIVSWSLNPQVVIDREEKGTPSLAARLAAASKCQDKGFRIGLHFDPIILFPGWEHAYGGLIRQVFATLSAEKIEWISLGSFRYRSNLKKLIRERHEESGLFAAEHVQSRDGKFRYFRPLRNRAYETLRRKIKQHSEELNVYLCMETKEIWEGVTGKTPRNDEKLNAFFDL